MGQVNSILESKVDYGENEAEKGVCVWWEKGLSFLTGVVSGGLLRRCHRMTWRR